MSLFSALIAYFLIPILTIVFYVLIAYVIFGWLVVGGVVSLQNPTARQIYSMLASVVEPLSAPIRRVVPPLGQLDFSVMILALIILFLRDYVLRQLMFMFG